MTLNEDEEAPSSMETFNAKHTHHDLQSTPIMKLIQLRFILVAALFLIEDSSRILSQEVPRTSETSVALQDIKKPDSPDKRQYQTGEIIIAWSEKRDELRGFSTKRGDWSILKVAPQTRLIVTAHGNVASIRLDNSLVAYSGELGWWDIIPLPKESKAVASVLEDLVTVQEGDHLYTFAASKGQWTSPTDPDLQPVNGKLRTYANKEQLTEIMFQETDPFFGHRNRQIRVGYRNPSNTNASPAWYEVEISAGRRSYLEEVIRTFKEIELFPPLKNAFEGESNNVTEMGQVSLQGLFAKIASLSEKMTRLENETVALGKSLSSKKMLTNEDLKALDELVAQSFDARQEMQQNESRLLTLKLEKVNENLTIRQNLRSRIVEKRVAELLDPSSDVMSWKTSKTDPSVALDRSTDMPRNTKRNGFRSTGVPETEKDGKVKPARWSEEAIWEHLGVRLSPLPASSIPDVGVDNKGGLRVVNVRVGSSAEQAGMQFGDIIVGIMDWQVNSMISLDWVLSNSQFLISRESKYYIIRKGKRLTLVVPTPSKKTTSQAAETGSGGSVNPPAKYGVGVLRPTPNQQTSPAEFTRLLREKKELFDKLTRSLETCQVTFSQMSDVYKLRSKPDLALEQELTKKQEEIGSLKRSQKATRDDWTQTWSSYQKQLRLARWDARDANEKVGAWRLKMEQTASLLKDGTVSAQENEEIVSRHKLALAKLERAMEQDTLYRDIESHAELNPNNAK